MGLYRGYDLGIFWWVCDLVLDGYVLWWVSGGAFASGGDGGGFFIFIFIFQLWLVVVSGCGCRCGGFFLL